MKQSAQKTLQAVADLICERGYSPTVRELCDHIGWASPHAAQRNLLKLRADGMVTWTERRSRTLCLTDQGQEFLVSLAKD